jgi:threonine dehydrogenase-like Zn-dependent dehydrogenase
VLGDGKLGQLIARAVVGAGRDAVVVGRHEAKLALVRDAGARAVLESCLGSELDGAAVVVEATGRAAGIALALRLVRPRGTVVLKTTIAGATSVDLSPVVINELYVAGSRCGNLETAVRAMAERRVDPTPLIEARYFLDEAPRAFRHAAQPGTLKVLIQR